MRKLYHSPRTRSLRVLWMLEEIGLTYDLVRVPFPPRVAAREFLRENPIGSVPLYVEGDVRLTESSAICQFLANRYADGDFSITSDEPDFGSYLDFIAYGEASLMFPLAICFRYSELEPEPQRLPRVTDDYRKFFIGRLRKLESHLNDGRQFLCGERFTAADVSVAYALKFAENRGFTEDFSTQIADYLHRMTQREAYSRASALDAAPPR